jgi:hypothetical protein
MVGIVWAIYIDVELRGWVTRSGKLDLKTAQMHSSTPSVFKRDPFTKNSDIASLERLRIIRQDTSITS